MFEELSMASEAFLELSEQLCNKLLSPLTLNSINYRSCAFFRLGCYNESLMTSRLGSRLELLSLVC